MKIYGFATQNNGCANFRLWQPLKMLERLGLAEVRREPDDPQPISADRIREIMEWADVIHVQPFSELWAAGLLFGARNAFRKQGKDVKVVVDLDDDIYAVHPLNLGVQDGQLLYLSNRFGGDWEDYWELIDIPDGEEHAFAQRTDGTCIKLHGKPTFLRNKAPDGKLVATAMLQDADMVTTTNEYLARVFCRKTQAPVKVLPNCLDFSEWPDPRKETSDEVWLGWCGSVSHYPDLKPLMPVFDELMREYPKLRFHVMGSSFDYLFPPKKDAQMNPVSGYGKEQMFHTRLEDCDERWPGRMAFHKPVPVQEYVPWFSQNFRADIAIAPIEDNDFNRAKSELKWLEYSALGIPTVASKVGPYERTIRPDVDGKLCGSPGAWKKALVELIEHPKRRFELAHEANKRVRTEYDAETRAREWVEAYGEVSCQAVS